MKKTKKITLISLLISFSLVLAHISHYLKVVPNVPITLDFSDIPIFISTLLFDSSYGYIILILVSIIRCLLFSYAGWPGVIIRVLTTSVAVLFLSLYKKSGKHFWMFSISASLLSTLIKLPLNYFFWINFFSMNYEYVNSILFSIIMPANIIKMIINISFAYLLCKKLKIFNVH